MVSSPGSEMSRGVYTGFRKGALKVRPAKT